jgi:hypothetical protein
VIDEIDGTRRCVRRARTDSPALREMKRLEV